MKIIHIYRASVYKNNVSELESVLPVEKNRTFSGKENYDPIQNVSFTSIKTVVTFLNSYIRKSFLYPEFILKYHHVYRRFRIEPVYVKEFKTSKTTGRLEIKHELLATGPGNEEEIVNLMKALKEEKIQ